jgi:hypothetical protein
VNDLLNNTSVKHGKIWELFLEWLDFIIDGHGVDYAIHPDGFDIGDMRVIDLVIYIIHIPLIH